MQTDQKRVVHGGGIREKEALKGRGFIDFSASLNPFPPDLPITIPQELVRAYPDDDYGALKSAIGTRFGRTREEITVGNGSIEILRIYCQAFLGRDLTYGVLEPTFGEYAYSARLTGAVPSQDPFSADVLFLCNPNNPDGRLTDRSDLLSLVSERAAEGKETLVDEAFIELADRDESLADVKKTGLFVMRSLTKSFAIPGLRFGYGLGDPTLIRRMEAMRPPWTVNCVAEEFAIAALTCLDELASSRRKIHEERMFLLKGLESAGFQCQPSETNFILATGKHPASYVATRLEESRILVRDCTSFGLPYSIRVAVRQHMENQQLIEALGSCLP